MKAESQQQQNKTVTFTQIVLVLHPHIFYDLPLLKLKDKHQRQYIFKLLQIIVRIYG